jgi:dihydroflavonol-4-reductase
MNVLVTGSTGFIGAALCRALVVREHTVRAFHRPTSNMHLLTDLPVEHAIGDLTQPETIRTAMQGIEVVFHVAAQLGGAGSDTAGRMYTVTVEGTRAVLRYAKDAGVRRVVLTSSAAALGVPERSPDPDTPSKAPPMDENHTWNFPPEAWPYGYAKYLAELEVQKAVANGLDAVILNPSVVFGAGDIYRRDSSVIMTIARRKLGVLVEGGLNAIHIQDVVQGHLAALERGRCGERYILAGENLTIVELIRKIAAVVGAPAPSLVLPAGLVTRAVPAIRLLQPFLDLPVSANDLRLAGNYFYYDMRKAQVELSLPPPRPIEEAIREAYDWFRS